MESAERTEKRPPTVTYDEADEHAPEIRLWLRMLACTTIIEASLRQKFREQFDFTLPRFEVLAQLDREPGGIVLGELSKRLMVSAGNMTPIIERLIKDGFITRVPSSLDRRLQIVCLTMDGRKKFRRMAKKNGEWLATIFGALPREEVEQLTQQLVRLKRVVANPE